MAIEYLERDNDTTVNRQKNPAGIEYLERDQYPFNPGMESSVVNRPHEEFNWFSTKDWSDAMEGLDYALRGDDKGNRDIGNIPGNVGSGAMNTLYGAAAGVNEFFGDISQYNPIGDGRNEHFDQNAQWWRDRADKNSVGEAIGEELGYGAGMGPVVSKVAPVLARGIGAGAGYLTGKLDQAALRRGSRYIDEIERKSGAQAGRVYRRHMPDEQYMDDYYRHGIETKSPEYKNYEAELKQERAKRYIADKMMEGSAFAPGNIVSRAIEIFSPRAGRLIREAGDEVVGRIPGQKSAAARRMERIIDDRMKRTGDTRDTVRMLIDRETNGYDDVLQLPSLRTKEPSLPYSRAATYGNALERVLNSRPVQGAWYGGIGLNAADSGLQTALDNELNRRIK